MGIDSPETQRIAGLEARVAALEALLERRSRELRLIQKHLCHRDLILVERVTAGFSPFAYGPFEPDDWGETTQLVPADVGDTLEALWSSLFPELDEAR